MKKPKRISPAILRERLAVIKDMINSRNYGMAERLIDEVMDCINTRYDWKKLREIETE